MKKIINFRPIFYCFVAFCLSLFFARYIFSGLISHIIFFGALVLTLFLICLKFKCLKRFVIIFCAFIVGIGYFYGGLSVYMGKTYDGEKVEVCGRIFSCSENESYFYVGLDSVKIDNKKITQNVQAYISSNTLIEVGDVIKFNATIKNIKPFELGEFSSLAYKKNIAYTCGSVSKLLVLENNKTLSEKVDESVTGFLEENLHTSYSWLIKAVIIGDKTELSRDIKSEFSASGIGHLLAVSGLHIGFIVMLFTFLFDKLRLKRVISTIILSVVLMLYCYICGFSPSVVRATVMSVIMLVASCIGRKYDSLNCLAIAGFIILMFKPLYIFDAGFLLSFFSVFCVLTIAKPITNLFNKIHVPCFLAKALGLTLAVQIGLLPIMAAYYGEFSVLSIFTNLICVPMFEVAYILAFVCLPICVLFPIFSFVLEFDEFLFSIISKIAMLVSHAKWSFIKIENAGFIFVVLCYVSMFVASGYVMLNGKLKIVLSCLILFIGVLGASIYNLPNLCNNFTVGYCSDNYVITYQGECIIVGNNIDENLIKFLEITNITKVDYIFHVGTLNKDDENVNIFEKTKIYDSQIIDKNINYETKNFEYCYFMPIRDFMFLELKFGGEIFTFVFDEMSQTEKTNFEFLYYGQKIDVCFGIENLENNNVDIDCDNYVSNTKINQIEKENWTSFYKNGMLTKVRSLD